MMNTSKMSRPCGQVPPDGRKKPQLIVDGDQMLDQRNGAMISG